MPIDLSGVHIAALSTGYPEKHDEALDLIQESINAFEASTGELLNDQDDRISAFEDAFVSGGTFKGGHDASTGSYPAAPAAGDVWIITVAGTMSSVAHLVRDRIIYTGSAWVRVVGLDISDFGSNPNQIPLNLHLGALAYLDTLGLNATENATPTLASATTIAPAAPISFVSGTTDVVNITAPASFTGGGQITLIPTGLWSTTAAGNIALATTAVVSKALIMTYDATTEKWYPSY